MRFLGQGLLLLCWLLQAPGLTAGDDEDEGLTSLSSSPIDSSVYQLQEKDDEEETEGKVYNKRRKRVLSNMAQATLDLARLRDGHTVEGWVEIPLNNESSQPTPSTSTTTPTPTSPMRKTPKPISDLTRNLNLLLDEPPSGTTSRRRCAAIIGALAGIAPIVPSCGVLRYTTRDILDAPQSSALGDVAIGITVVALTPPFMGICADFGRKLLNSRCCFSQSPEVLGAEQACMFPISRAHRTLKVFLAGAVAINSLHMVAQMAQIELQDVEPGQKAEAQGFVIGWGPFYFLVDSLLNWDNGIRELNHFFFNKVYLKYDAAKTIKTFLTERINIKKQKFKSASDSEIQRVYGIVMNQNQEGKHREKVRYLIAEEPADGFLNMYSRRGIADFIAKGMIVLGTGGRFETIFYISNLALGENGLGADPTTTFWVGGTFAVVGSAGRLLWEANLHHEFMRRVLRCEEKDTSPDSRSTQVIASTSAGVGAALFSIYGISLGMKALGTRYPLGAKVILLGASGFLNFSAYLGSLRRSALVAIRSIAGRCLSEREKMRKVLMKKCDKFKTVVERLNDKTTEDLYEWSVRTVLDSHIPE